MSNSPLVKYTQLSPNHSGKRAFPLTRITIHCVVGQTSMKSLCDVFAKKSRKASSNYGVCVDGICLIVDEENRSWCSSSSDNDNRAITIEVASDTFHPYAVRDDVFNDLIELLVDICKRNGKSRLVWFGDKKKTLAYTPKDDELVLTVHRWFANKSCPGDYLYNKHNEIVQIVNERIGGCEEMGCPYWKEGKCTKDDEIKVGDLVEIVGSVYYNGKQIPSWVKSQKWFVHSLSGDRVVINKNEKGTNAIMSPINKTDLRKV